MFRKKKKKTEFIFIKKSKRKLVMENESYINFHMQIMADTINSCKIG